MEIERGNGEGERERGRKRKVEEKPELGVRVVCADGCLHSYPFSQLSLCRFPLLTRTMATEGMGDTRSPRPSCSGAAATLSLPVPPRL